jgi:hypothetical protein
MSAPMKLFAALCIALLASLLGNAKRLPAEEPNPVTAIDVLLEPDGSMLN